jgi:hypothetical protein
MRATALCFLGILSALTATALWLSVVRRPELADNTPKSQVERLRRLSRLPVSFIENQGQVAAPGVAYHVQSRTTAAYFTPGGVVYALRQPRLFQPVSTSTTSDSVSVVRQEFLGANPNPRLEALQPTGAKVNYFRGSPEQWVTDVPTYATVLYRDLWSGIDLAYTGPEGNLKYTFHVRAGADPTQIRFAYRGASRLSLTPRGSLHVETPAGSFSDDAPVAWQEINGERVPVSTAFRLQGNEVSFDLGNYDRSRDLVLDPVVLVYSGYIGGGSEDKGRAIAVDSSGNAYVTGYTFSSTGFATAGAFDTTFNSGGDAFITKVNASGTAVIYSTYLGGSASDYGEGIAVDAAGNAYVAGWTYSANFPTTAGAFDTTYNGSGDIFMTKLAPAGNALVYSTYIGGSNEDRAWTIAIDNAGNAYTAGDSAGGGFPVTVGIFSGGARDSVVCKLNAAGTVLTYSLMVGGSGDDQARGIAIDSQNAAYVTGYTNSADFLVGIGPDTTPNGGFDAFLYKVNPAGTVLNFSGFIGGAGTDVGLEVAVDPGGNSYVTGHTQSGDFPTTLGAFDTSQNGDFDAFVTKVSPTGTTLVYSTFLGGALADYGRDIAVDGVGNAYVIGHTSSANFPVNADGPDTTHNGAFDAFVAKLNGAGATLLYSGYMGGSANEEGEGLAIDSTGASYITGWAFSDQTTFPVTVGPDLTSNGGGDAFVAKISAFPGTAGPSIAFRNGFNAIEVNTFPFPLLRNAGGNFRLNPAVAYSASGRMFIAARDSSVGIWINFLKPDNLFNGWAFAGGNSPGNPDLGVSGETAWVVFRDPWNSYWVRSFTPGVGFGASIWLQGIFASLPKIAGCPNGDLYVVGRDNFNGLWTRRYSSGTASWQAWQFAGGITQGTPGIACGSDNAAYIAVRDNSNNMWLARVFQESAPTWNYGAGIWDGDLQVAADGNRIHVVGLSFSTPYYRTWQVGGTWLGALTTPGGVLAHLTPAVYNGNLYLAGQDFSGNVFWWSMLSNSFSNFGANNVAASSRFSGGAR